MPVRNNFILMIALLIASAPIYAQDDSEDNDPDNLVPNGGFEKYEGTLRRDEQFDLTTDWTNGSDIVPDLFATNTKSKYVSIPENIFGNESPFEGENYAGIVAYSYRNKKPRTYLAVQLKKKMKENTLYCIHFRASLAERSRYACNNLGVVISKSKVIEKTGGNISRSDAIVTDRNETVTQTDGWWEFCKRYAAKGGEQYLAIGNFGSDGGTTNETLELPKEYTEAGPEIAAYYYIDGVELRAIETNENCGCENTKIPDSKIIYSATVQIEDDMTMNDKVAAIDAYFYQYQSEVVAAAQRTIDQIVDLMESNPEMKVLITGHSDNEEAELAKKESSLKTLAEDRAKNAREYIASKGIDRTRILMEDKGNSQPVSSMSTPISMAKNRRVEFKLVL